MGITLARREHVASSNFFIPLFPSSLPKRIWENKMVTRVLISLVHLLAGGGGLTLFTQPYETTGGYSEFINVECFKYTAFCRWLSSSLQDLPCAHNHLAWLLKKCRLGNSFRSFSGSGWKPHSLLFKQASQVIWFPGSWRGQGGKREGRSHNQRQLKKGRGARPANASILSSTFCDSATTGAGSFRSFPDSGSLCVCSERYVGTVRERQRV